MNGIYHVKGKVKHYDWGGSFFLPSLLKLENKGKKPFAEYWIGTHPLGPAELELQDDDTMPMEKKSGTLDFLLKVLDVKDMLSIQVHPSKDAARREFERENAEGIPMDSPNRNYKDPNHKPELMVAISDFWALHGFKPAEDLHDILINVTELNELIPVFKDSGYKGLYQHVMEMPQSAVNRILRPLVERITPLYYSNKLDKQSEDFWAARAAIQYSSSGDIDRGLFSIYFFNLLKLKKGEGIFQAAGVPHAYLEGQNIEIMANSDNVLRGGLTNKHIDVKELMKHIMCEATYPEIIVPSEGGIEKIYKTPSTEFKLSVFELEKDQQTNFNALGPELILMAEGNVSLKNGESILELGSGNITALVLPGNETKLTANEDSRVFRAIASNSF